MLCLMLVCRHKKTQVHAAVCPAWLHRSQLGLDGGGKQWNSGGKAELWEEQMTSQVNDGKEGQKRFWCNGIVRSSYWLNACGLVCLSQSYSNRQWIKGGRAGSWWMQLRVTHGTTIRASSSHLRAAFCITLARFTSTWLMYPPLVFLGLEHHFWSDRFHLLSWAFSLFRSVLSAAPVAICAQRDTHFLGIEPAAVLISGVSLD